MIFDAFIFCKEVDLLEGRLEYLYNYVDYFIILEADTKYNGESRELVYPKNLSRYRKYQDKIIYVPYSADLTGYDFNVKIDQYTGDIAHWKLEARMREEGFGRVLKLLDNKDVFILSDVDEIPDRTKIKDIVSHLSNKVPRIMLQQKTFYGNFDKVQIHPELATTFSYAKHVRDYGVWNVRNSRGITPVYPDAGWHLSCWMTAEEVVDKIQSFSHQEFNKPQYLDNIVEHIKTKGDYLGRDYNPFEPFDKSTLPKEFLDIFEKYIKI